MEQILITILFLIVTIFFFCILIKQHKKYKELKQLQDFQIEERYKKEFSEKIEKQKEGISQLEKEKIKIQNEINEKQSFNSSLFKLREDELNRLIEEKRKEKEKILEEHLRAEDIQLKNEYDRQFALWTQQKENEKTNYLKEFEALQNVCREQITEIQNELNEFQSKQKAINEQLRREEELKNEIDFHRIVLNKNDKEDISYLISIEQNIHNKELLYKLIWSEYIQKSFNQMIKNICGSKTYKNVIYCIENINDHKKYIGKTSAEVSKRWTEHVKNSLNIGGIKRQLVHDAMYGHWDEFTFSILEEVENEKLSEREKYYISFFETDKYGYNLKGGG